GHHLRRGDPPGRRADRGPDALSAGPDVVQTSRGVAASPSAKFGAHGADDRPRCSICAATTPASSARAGTASVWSASAAQYAPMAADAGAPTGTITMLRPKVEW